MGKFGKKNVVNTDLSRYIFGLLGESGIGKTTTMYKICDKLFGEDGYIVLDCGKEVGTNCINGVVAERIENYKKFIEVTDDIIKNKATDYPNLKVVIGDTIDQLFDIGEPYLVKLYNQEHMGEKNFTPVKTINAVEGGFMHGQDRLIDMVLDRIFKLYDCGVGFWYTGHVKNRSSDDVFTGESYDQLTTSMSQRYFNSIKNKTHFLGIAYIDRAMEEEEYGEQNPITKKRKTRNKITSEARKVKFRDDSYTADSKCRFASIVDEVTLDEDELIEAMKDAIKAEVNRIPSVESVVAKPKATKKATPAPVVEPEDDDEDTTIPFDVDDDLDVEVDFAAMRTEIRNLNKSGTAEQKKAVKAIIASTGKKLDEIDDMAVFTSILEIFE
jgi:hypothetical protein